MATVFLLWYAQQDVFAMTSAHLLQQMQQNPITWADSERINSFFHSAMHRMYDERVVSSAVHHAGSRLCVNATQLKALGVATKLDISALRCLYFTFAAPQPLRVLFSASVVRKYSRLAAFLLQVKAVESAIIKVRVLACLLCRRCSVLSLFTHCVMCVVRSDGGRTVQAEPPLQSLLQAVRCYEKCCDWAERFAGQAH